MILSGSVAGEWGAVSMALGADVMGLTLSMQVSCWGSPVGIIITMVGAYSLRTYSVWATMQGSSHHVHSFTSSLQLMKVLSPTSRHRHRHSILVTQVQGTTQHCTLITQIHHMTQHGMLVTQVHGTARWSALGCFLMCSCLVNPSAQHMILQSVLGFLRKCV